MAGHSKWKNIQNRKGAQDAKRGRLFTKLIKEIMVSVRTGGEDPTGNPRLRAALETARTSNMPKDNIERAIKKASGADGTELVEITYEGYGPEGVAIFVECATDNTTRTVGNVRSAFNRYGGSLGKDGCLQFVFNRQSVFSVAVDQVKDMDEFQLALIDAGAEDFEVEDDVVTVYGAMENFGSIQQQLSALSVETQEAGLQRIPTLSKQISPEAFGTVMKLIERLEEDDDVQKVYHNIEFSEELAAQM